MPLQATVCGFHPLPEGVDRPSSILQAPRPASWCMGPRATAQGLKVIPDLGTTLRLTVKSWISVSTPQYSRMERTQPSPHTDLGARVRGLGDLFSKWGVCPVCTLFCPPSLPTHRLPAVP